MHGIPFFCISVALIKIQDGESTALLGAICNPISKEIFWAGKQVGAFLIDSLGIQKKIRISHHIWSWLKTGSRSIATFFIRAGGMV